MNFYNKALFLDRDGVINVNYGYVHNQENFVFIPGIFDVCRYFIQKGYDIFVITNQAGIAKGYYTYKDFEQLTHWLYKEFIKNDIIIKKIYFCPHKEDDNCYCRKPNPGMILQAAEEFNIDLNKSFIIGDSNSDIIAGKNAGLKCCYKFNEKSHSKTIENITKICQI